MKSNFSFLSKKWIDLYNVGHSAEKNVLKDPKAALIKLRLFGEVLVKYVSNCEGLSFSNRLSQKEKLDDLYTKGILDIEMFTMLDTIRKIGNKAVHEAYYGSIQEAKSLLKHAFYLGAWLEQTYGDWTFEMPNFIEPMGKLELETAINKNPVTYPTILKQSLSTEIIRFLNDDAGYEQWLQENVIGFVFNHFRGSDGSKDMNKFHRSSCRFLLRKQDEGKRTTIEKICSTNLEGLEPYVIQLRENSWVYCKGCNP